MKLEFEPGAKAAKPAVKSLPPTEALVRAIADDVILNNPGGGTFDPRRSQCVKFGPNSDRSLYVVSVAHHELQLPQPPDVETLCDWIGQRLEIPRRPRYFVGGWPYAGKFILDVSLLFQGRDAAMRLAQANEQLAVFHPHTNQNIRLPCEADTVGPSAGQF
jgi:hypothetical protein